MINLHFWGFNCSVYLDLTWLGISFFHFALSSQLDFISSFSLLFKIFCIFHIDVSRIGETRQSSFLGNSSWVVEISFCHWGLCAAHRALLFNKSGQMAVDVETDSVSRLGC